MAVSRRNRFLRAIQTYSGLLLMLLCLMGNVALAEDPAALSEAVMEISSTGMPGEMMVVLRGPDGQFFLEEADFSKLRLKLPATQPTMHEGRRYYDPRAIPGCKFGSLAKVSQFGNSAFTNVFIR